MSRSVLGVIVILLLVTPPKICAQAADSHHHHQSAAMVPDSSGSHVEVEIPNAKVVTQDGRTVDFYQDLIQGKVVAINFIFTTCTTICPPLGAMFASLQKDNQHRLGMGLYLISVSIDPGVDNPQRLKAWGRKFGAEPSWTLVTGDKEQIAKILKGLKVYTPRFQDHQPITLIGNDATGTWRRAYGFPSTERLTAMIDEVSVRGVQQR